MPFTAVPAAKVPEGQDVLIGDIRVLAGTRIAFIQGLSAGVLTNMPNSTLFGNLFTEDAPGRPFKLDRFIGSGLTVTNHLTNGPFPEVVAENQQAFPTSGTSITVELPTPLFRDRYIVATQHNGSNSITTPSGWTLKSHVALADSDMNIYEFIVDQTFVDNSDYSVTFVASTAGAALAKVWMIRYAHTSLTCEVVNNSNTSTGGTSNDIGTLTPTWGLASNLWLTFIGLEADDASPPHVTAYPSGFSSTGELQNVSGTASLDGAIAWGLLPGRLTSLDPSAYTHAASRSAAFLIAVPPRVTAAISTSGGAGSQGWDDTLAIDAHSGANNPIVDDAQYLQFGIDTPPATGQIRTDEPWEARGAKKMKIRSAEDIQLQSVDGSEWTVSGGTLLLQSQLTATLESTTSSINITSANNLTATAVNNITLTPSGAMFLGSSTLTDSAAINAAGVVDVNAVGNVLNLSGTTGVNVISSGAEINLDASTFVGITGGFLRFIEKAASTPSMAAGQALFWVKSDTPNNPFFTDDTNADRQIATFPIPLSGFATIADDTFLGNVSGGTAAPSAVNLSTLAGAGLVFSTHTLNVTAGAGGSLVVGANDIQRAALTGAITATQDSNATAFGALAAKSVLANATNAAAVPAALAGSAAFQHLRVNSANTGLEWSVFTTGDFPNNSVPITALATIATDTFLANVTAGTATPTAVNLSTLAGAGLVFGSHTLDVTAGAGGSIVVTANDVQRGALTGAITATQDSNTTVFGSAAAKSVLANATNAGAVPAFLAGSVASTYLRVNAANTALEFGALAITNAEMATMAANTIKANATAATAVPGDLAIAAESVVGRTSGNLQAVTSSAQSILMRAAGSMFWGTAAADQVLRRSGSGDLGFGTLVTNNIGDDQVTIAKIQNIATASILGRVTAATGDIEVLTSTQATTLINVFTSALKGLVPASGGGTANFLRADGTFAVPPGTGTSPTSGNSITVTGGQIDLTGSTSNVNLTLLTGAQGVVNIAALQCGGSVTIETSSADFTIAGFTAKTDGFWFDLIDRRSSGSDFGTLLEDSGSTSTSIRNPINTPTSFTNGYSTRLVYRDTRWRVTSACLEKPEKQLSATTGTINNEVRTRDEAVLMAAPTADLVLTGVDVATYRGQMLHVHRQGTTGLFTINDEDSGSSANNRFANPGQADLRLVDDEVASYIATDIASGGTDTLRWLCISHRFPFCNTSANLVGDTIEHDGTDWVVRQVGTPVQSPGVEYIDWEDQDFDHLVVGTLGLTTSLQDVFIGITNGSPSHWGTTANAARGSYGDATPQVGHRGIAEFTTGNVANDFALLAMSLSKSTTLTAIIGISNILAIDWWVQLSGTMTSVNVAVGFGTDPTAANLGVTSAHFIFDPAVNANWQCITRLSSSNTTTTTAIAGNTSWRRFTIWRHPNGTEFRFYINGSLVATHTTTLPTGNTLPSIRLQTTNTTTKTFRVDRCRILTTVGTLVT